MGGFANSYLPNLLLVSGPKSCPTTGPAADGNMEKLHMRLSKTIAAICLLASAVSAQAAVCLNNSEIENSDSPDGKVLILKMKNGKIWHTALKPACPGIRFNGFSWNINAGQICENSQILRVLQSGELCAIGKFVAGEPLKQK